MRRSLFTRGLFPLNLRRLNASPHPFVSLGSYRFPIRLCSTSSDYYSVLGVSPTASPDEIKSAYKKLALQYHPDRNHEPGAEEKFKNISAAYNVIGNKTKRAEYDLQRQTFSRSSDPGMGGVRPPYGYNSNASQQYRSMSKDEADRLFREIFGGMRVDQIFRNLEEEMRRGNIRTGSGLGSNVGQSFDPSQQAFRPFFRTEQSSRIFTDEFGNRHEETVYVDPRGERFTVRRSTSSDPNASVNQTNEEWNNNRRRGDGRVRFGSSASRQKEMNTDFTQQYFGIRSHGRNPIVAFFILGLWFFFLCFLVYCFCYMIVFHPFLVLFLMFLSLALRRGF